MKARRPAEVFHPGEHLLDELNARGWSQIEFAEIINRSVTLVNEIVNGKRGITHDTAIEIGAALGTGARFWMNLDTAYNLWKIEIEKDTSSLEHRARMRTAYPIRDMVLRGWIRKSEDSQVVESQLLRFFGISSLDQRPRLTKVVATKRSAPDQELTPTQLAWLYRVKQLAEGMPTEQYSKRALKSAVDLFLAFREAPEEIRHVPKLLRECGVRFVIVEALPSSKIDGVTFWLDAQSPVIGMTLRFDRIDNFWFVLRHEIEHVLNEHGKGKAIVDSELDSDSDDWTEEEIIANAAAAEFCVPQADLGRFISRVAPLFSRVKVLGFAQKHRLHPGLVAGQLQRRLKRYDLFRQMLVPIRNIITPVALTDGLGYALPVDIP